VDEQISGVKPLSALVVRQLRIDVDGTHGVDSPLYVERVSNASLRLTRPC
jgi:hypothetical protein